MTTHLQRLLVDLRNAGQAWAGEALARIAEREQVATDAGRPSKMHSAPQPGPPGSGGTYRPPPSD